MWIFNALELMVEFVYVMWCLKFIYFHVFILPKCLDKSHDLLPNLYGTLGLMARIWCFFNLAHMLFRSLMNHFKSIN